MLRIDLNADVGESFGPWPMGDDAALMPSLTSANIACGVHAGDPGVMRRTLQLARTHGVAAGLSVAAEIFADRSYEADGSLTPRHRPGSVISDPSVVVERAVAMVTTRTVVATTGEQVALQADTLCLHGDTPGAAELARRLRAALESRGVLVVAVGTARTEL